MIFRNIRPEDFENGFFETISNLSSLDGLTVDRAKIILSEMNPDSYHVYVMEDDDKIVGTVTLFVEQKFTHNAGVVGHIEEVATRKDYEGKGIASILLKHAISQAKSFNCYKIVLTCSDDNIKFYERFGFRKHENSMRLDIK